MLVVTVRVADVVPAAYIWLAVGDVMVGVFGVAALT